MFQSRFFRGTEILYCTTRTGKFSLCTFVCWCLLASRAGAGDAGGAAWPRPVPPASARHQGQHSWEAAASTSGTSWPSSHGFPEEKAQTATFPHLCILAHRGCSHCFEEARRDFCSFPFKMAGEPAFVIQKANICTTHKTTANL